MGKNRNKSNDLTLQGYQVFKKKVRSDGHQVVLAELSKKSKCWVLAHIDPTGQIADSRTYFWSEKTKGSIQKMATRDYHIWCEVLFEHLKDFDGIDFAHNVKYVFTNE